MFFINDAIRFFSERTVFELIASFWYFFVFDFTRYALLDSILVAVYLIRRKKDRENSLDARQKLYRERPLITIIAPGKNEGAHLPSLCNSLRNQTYSNIEIIVVDDGSDDSTPAICRDLLKRGQINCFFRNDVRGGKASAANLALLYSKGKYIVHLDADSYLNHDSIEKIILPFYMYNNVGAVAGDIHISNVSESLATHFQAFEYMKGITVGRTASSVFGILRIISGAFGAFRKDILDRLKGWDVGPGLDGDLTLKIRKLHYKVLFEPEAVCYTNVPNTFFKLMKQRYRWDRSLIRFRLRKHIDILRPDKNFSFLNFISSLENVFFNLGLNIKWWLYISYIVLFQAGSLHIIIFVNLIMYSLLNIFQFLLGCIIYGRSLKRSEAGLIFLAPLMPFYTALYLRFIRTYAYIMELFFKASYIDRWNPWKVSKVVRKENL